MSTKIRISRVSDLTRLPRRKNDLKIISSFLVVTEFIINLNPNEIPPNASRDCLLLLSASLSLPLLYTKKVYVDREGVLFMGISKIQTETQLNLERFGFLILILLCVEKSNSKFIKGKKGKQQNENLWFCEAILWSVGIIDIM